MYDAMMHTWNFRSDVIYCCATIDCEISELWNGVKVVKVDGVERICSSGIFDIFCSYAEAALRTIFMNVSSCAFISHSEHHAETKFHWIHNKFSGFCASEFIKYEFKLEDGWVIGREQCEEESGNWWRVRLDRRFNWTLRKMAVRYDNSVIVVSSAKYVSHLFAHISSKLMSALFVFLLLIFSPLRRFVI